VVIAIHLVRLPHFGLFLCIYDGVIGAFYSRMDLGDWNWFAVYKEGSSDWKHSVWWEPLFFRIDQRPGSGAAVMSSASVVILSHVHSVS